MVANNWFWVAGLKVADYGDAARVGTGASESVGPAVDSAANTSAIFSGKMSLGETFEMPANLSMASVLSGMCACKHCPKAEGVQEAASETFSWLMPKSPFFANHMDFNRSAAFRSIYDVLRLL
ncbi:MAG: hypothetical protein JMN27_12305 [gamma proteobacterium endosymbiont of Lamellibrachia anaximandri]|nr:hypothetical protein [gamma proteobacterium endosymbiont of Lamellibrachia anaximandri]MBL3534602.1 hypothetical protein [gamma proteobacterium endosymbiont of Lamellibrachia anaximandri]